MSKERCAKLERKVRKYDEALKYLNNVCEEFVKMDNQESSLKHLVDTCVRLQGRISEMGFQLQVLKNVEAGPV